MQQSTQMSDALTIARWCWPKYTWKEGIESEVYTEECGTDDSCWEFWPDEYGGRPQDCEQNGRKGVSDAESVLIECGLAENYGNALCWELWGNKNHPEFKFRGDWAPNLGADLAELATAPLNVRVRAMAAVIRHGVAVSIKSN